MIVCRNAIGQQNLSDIINKNHTCVGAVQESKNPISIEICEHDFVNEITPVNSVISTIYYQRQSICH